VKRTVAAAGAALALAAGGAGSELGGGATSAAQQPPPAPVAEQVAGRSVLGRPIDVVRVGDPAAPRRVLVVGCVHGDECAARTVLRALLARRTVPPDVQLLLVPTANPDGERRHTRQNAHGVDLNRNSSQGWRRLRGRYSSGARPWSEPESRAMRALLVAERPQVVVWYHQPLTLVDAPESGSDVLARRFAALVGLPFRPLQRYPGSLSRWTNAHVRHGSSFVVELPSGPLSPRAARRHADAVLALAAG